MLIALIKEKWFKQKLKIYLRKKETTKLIGEEGGIQSDILHYSFGPLLFEFNHFSFLKKVAFW